MVRNLFFLMSCMPLMLSDCWAMHVDAPLLLAVEGKANHFIVTGCKPIPAEETAAHELAGYLKKATGAEFKIVRESDVPANTPGIYLGWTDFAGTHAIDPVSLGAEEWLLRRVGDNLVITGGRPRGTLYSVYEFLETQIGVRWLDRDSEVVPTRTALVIGNLELKGKPVFRFRNINTRFYEVGFGGDAAAQERELLFRIRSRNNQACYDRDGRFGGGDYFCPVYKFCHNFGVYLDSQKYFAEHPEYFVLKKDGTRIPADPNGAGGQLCFTNPEVRRIVLSRLLEMIADDRKKCVAKGYPLQTVYDVSQHDNWEMCQCPGCRQLVEREGAESGALIDFINALADGVRATYPDILLQTFAYMPTVEPPSHIRPRDNVIIRWCDWGMRGPQPNPEPWHPMTAPCNAWRAENLRQWGSISKQLTVWDYAEPYSTPRLPFTLAPMLSDDLRFFADTHVIGLFIQNEEAAAPWGMGQFTRLYNWLCYQLLRAPYQQADPLVDSFMAGYYGQAAPMMRNFYDMMAQGQHEMPTRNASGGNVRMIGYVTPTFYVEAEKLFDQAEAVCSHGSRELLHVQRERQRLDLTLLENWNTVKEKLPKGESMPFEQKAIIARVEERANPLLDGLGFAVQRGGFRNMKNAKEAQREDILRDLASFIDNLRNPLELPSEFRDLPEGSVTQFYWPEFKPYGTVIVPDHDSVAGKALRREKTDAEDHNAPPVFGLYDFVRKKPGPTLTIPLDQVPQDGKYHLYKIGRWSINPGVQLWAHASWYMRCELARAYVFNDNPGANDWDVYVSAKFTGPAYIKGTNGENGYFIDRVVLVKPQP